MSVAEYMEVMKGVVFWQSILGRSLHIWEIEAATQIFGRIQDCRIFTDKKIEKCWKQGIGSSFSVKACYNILIGPKELISLGEIFGSVRFPQSLVLFVDGLMGNSPIGGQLNQKRNVHPKYMPSLIL